METLLPNGTIVLLKGGNKRLMMYVRKQISYLYFMGIEMRKKSSKRLLDKYKMYSKVNE